MLRRKKEEGRKQCTERDPRGQQAEMGWEKKDGNDESRN